MHFVGMANGCDPAIEWGALDAPPPSSTAIVPSRNPPSQQEAYPASSNQPCSFCQCNTSRAYFE
eukprot:3038561-Prorocentrum_lima.AAC.1